MMQSNLVEALKQLKGHAHDSAHASPALSVMADLEGSMVSVSASSLADDNNEVRYCLCGTFT
jgi:hypothetical protein